MCRNKLLLLVLIISLSGCAAAPSLKMPKEDLIRIGPNDGIVFGSVKIQVEGKPWKNFMAYSLHDTKWIVSVSDYDLKIIADGEEVPFAAKLPEGHYSFDNLRDSKGDEVRAVGMNACFNVLAGQSTYIGRLNITLPNYISNPMFIGVGVAIEDAQNETISFLKGEYGGIISNSTKMLMEENCGAIKTSHEW